jgi:hypothetical protein
MAPSAYPCQFDDQHDDLLRRLDAASRAADAEARRCIELETDSRATKERLAEAQDQRDLANERIALLE